MITSIVVHRVFLDKCWSDNRLNFSQLLELALVSKAWFNHCSYHANQRFTMRLIMPTTGKLDTDPLSQNSIFNNDYMIHISNPYCLWKYVINLDVSSHYDSMEKSWSSLVTTYAPKDIGSTLEHLIIGHSFHDKRMNELLRVISPKKEIKITVSHLEHKRYTGNPLVMKVPEDCKLPVMEKLIYQGQHEGQTGFVQSPLLSSEYFGTVGGSPLSRLKKMTLMGNVSVDQLFHVDSPLVHNLEKLVLINSKVAIDKLFSSLNSLMALKSFSFDTSIPAGSTYVNTFFSKSTLKSLELATPPAGNESLLASLTTKKLSTILYYSNMDTVFTISSFHEYLKIGNDINLKNIKIPSSNHIHKLVVDRLISTPEQFKTIFEYIRQCPQLTELHLNKISIEDPRITPTVCCNLSDLFCAITKCKTLQFVTLRFNHPATEAHNRHLALALKETFISDHLIADIHFTKHYLNQSKGVDSSKYIALNGHTVHIRYGKKGSAIYYVIPNELFKNFIR